MASSRGALSLLCFLVICAASSSHAEARESVFFSKMSHPVRRYSQLVSSSLPALTPLPSPAPAPAPSQGAPAASENYVYGFYGEEVGEFPVATSKAADETAHKTSGADDDFMNDSHFFTQDDSKGSYGGSDSDTRYNSYQNDDDDDGEYSSSNNARLSRHPTLYQNSYSNNDNVDNYDDETRSYHDDSKMYSSNYNTDEYTNAGGNYNSDRSRARRFGDNGRYYNENGDGYYRDNESPNEFNSMEEYEGVYQP
uniref:Uncharacterized protein n=1 Tax=Kalanchoe fedtschenkoi TaxID=63787 RepID=A0A7N1A3M3_KALFE